jgi:hypothetical protein
LAKLTAKLAKEPVAMKVPAVEVPATAKKKVVRKYRKAIPDLVGEGNRMDN